MNRSRPIRTCIGCKRTEAKHHLLRLVNDSKDRIVPDPEGRLPGRGAHVHPNARCIEAAADSRRLSRAFRRRVTAATNLSEEVLAHVRRKAM